MTEASRNLITNIRIQEGGIYPDFYIAEDIPTRTTLSIEPNEYRELENTYLNGKPIYVRTTHTS